MAAESEQNAARGVKERQVQAEEEARLALLTSQAGMKLTLTDKVNLTAMYIRPIVACTFLHRRVVRVAQVLSSWLCSACRAG